MIPVPKPHLLVASQTHPGMTGKNNEDRFAVAQYRQSASNPVPVLFSVVCDGIGGHRSGEIAADLAVNAIINTVSSSFGDEPLNTMQRSVQLANEAIYTRAQENERFRGMGATVAMVWMAGKRLFTTTIGDSRIYLIRKNSIRQVSTDHTWIQEALDNGTITPEQAVNHPNSHVIRRYLGAPVLPVADQRLNLRAMDNDIQALANQGVELMDEDSILLCSDGLTDHVQDKEIALIVQKHAGKIQLAVAELVDLACQRGGKDNITIILITIPRPNFFKKLFHVT
jgi:PPM family protein phosphatase